MPASSIKKTKLDYILWYNDIELKEIQNTTGLSYPLLIDLKKGANRKFNPRSLRDVAEFLGIEVSVFYDIERGEHIYHLGSKKKK